MKKDAYYFPHYSNARQDRKVLRLRKQLGIEGYGIYFMLLEVLREQTDFTYPLSDLDLLADEFGTSEAKVSAVVNGYDLFMVNHEQKFFSPKLVQYLQPYLEKTKRAQNAAKLRWGVSLNTNELDEKSDAFALQMHSKCNTNAMQIRMQGEERREDKGDKGEESGSRAREENHLAGSNLFRQPNAPTLDQVKMHFAGAGGTEEMAVKFFEKWEGVGWFYNGSPIVKWANFANNYIQTWQQKQQKEQSGNKNKFKPRPL